MERRFEHRAAQISFTSDFHELLEGDLRPDTRLTLRYDPARLSPPDGYIFGDPRWPVVAHLRYGDHGPVTELTLAGRVTPAPDHDPMGQGSMLTASTALPPDAAFVELWLSGTMPDGERWDSDYGTNYWFRFPYLDVDIAAADVDLGDPAQARFRLRVTTAAADVEALRVRFSDISTRVRVSRDEPLQADGRTAARREWSFEAPVAPTAVIRFKLYYWLGGRRYKDDNSGQYYLASRLEFREEVPKPPAALIAAEQAWSQKLRMRSGGDT